MQWFLLTPRSRVSRYQNLGVFCHNICHIRPKSMHPRTLLKHPVRLVLTLPPTDDMTKYNSKQQILRPVLLSSIVPRIATTAVQRIHPIYLYINCYKLVQFDKLSGRLPSRPAFEEHNTLNHGPINEEQRVPTGENRGKPANNCVCSSFWALTTLSGG